MWEYNVEELNYVCSNGHTVGVSIDLGFYCYKPLEFKLWGVEAIDQAKSCAFIEEWFRNHSLKGIRVYTTPIIEEGVEKYQSYTGDFFYKDNGVALWRSLSDTLIDNELCSPNLDKGFYTKGRPN